MIQTSPKLILTQNQPKVTFTAIDNCIEIEGKRCDGTLTHKNCIIFVELKERLMINYQDFSLSEISECSRAISCSASCALWRSCSTSSSEEGSSSL